MDGNLPNKLLPMVAFELNLADSEANLETTAHFRRRRVAAVVGAVQFHRETQFRRRLASTEVAAGRPPPTGAVHKRRY